MYISGFDTALECKNRRRGCKWMGSDQDQLKVHLQSCDYAILPCTNECLNKDKVTKLERRKLRHHLTNECPRRQYQCPHCEEMGEHQERTTSHLKFCPMVEVSCPNEPCQASIPRCRIASHQLTCDYERVYCKYANVGCKERPLRKDLKKHEEDNEASYHHKLSIQAPSKYSAKTAVASIASGKKAFTVAPFRFKLTDFERHKKEKEEFCSPAFYTSRQGYKLCVEVYANGNDSGENTHVSVFARIMNGDNDDFLTWPFAGTVIFELLNQLEENNHYGKPAKFTKRDITKRVDQDELGLAGGFPKFISHSDLEKYLKHDTLFFRVSVQLHSSPDLYTVDFPKPLVVSHALRFSSELPFIKPVEVLQVSRKGKLYRDDSLGLCIDVPEGAVPEGRLLQLEIGMCLYGPFKFPGDLYPIAPILMLCPQNNIKLNKSMRVTLPHILSDTNENDVESFGVQVIKADHTSLFIACETIFDTIIGESNLFFHTSNNYEFATFALSHFCFVTIRATANLQELAKKRGYCICPLIPSPKALSSGSFMYPLCVTYFIEPCLEVCIVILRYVLYK